MKPAQHAPLGVTVALLVVIVGVPVMMNRGEPSPTPADGLNLVIVTPHNEQIRYEFGRGFSAWRAAMKLPAVVFDWRTSGGTSHLRKTIVAEFKAKIADRREHEGIGYDLFFGGGDYEHGLLARGIETERDGQIVRIPLSVPAQISEPLLQEVYGGPLIGSERLYDPQLRWMGAALASFGIVYNRDVLGQLGLQAPRQWADLADGRYFRWVALADPAHSGSIAATYNAILRREGWDAGWRLLRQVFANARYFTSSASKVSVDVSAGEAMAGMCIDFYGRFQAGAIAGDRVGYVDPHHMTAITADPISILRGAPQLALAQQFVTWLLSKEAQRLWQMRLGSEDGPDRFELRRLPIRRDLYRPDEMRSWVDDTNPFVSAKAFPEGMPNFYRTVAPVAHAMAIDVHQELTAAWRAILTTPDTDLKQRMLEAFEKMPPALVMPWPDAELAADWQALLEDGKHRRHGDVVAVLEQFMSRVIGDIKDAKRLVNQRRQWTEFFRGQYRLVVQMAP